MPFWQDRIIWGSSYACFRYVGDCILVLCGTKRAKSLWSSAILAGFWVIWLERNVRIFKYKYEEMEGLWDRVCFFASLWALVEKLLKGIPQFLVFRNWLEICSSKFTRRRHCLGSYFYTPWFGCRIRVDVWGGFLVGLVVFCLIVYRLDGFVFGVCAISFGVLGS